MRAIKTRRWPCVNRVLPAIALIAGLVSSSRISEAGTLPSNPGLQFQTSSQGRPPTIGDWYTTSTSSSTDRVHRIVVEVSQALLDANGGTVNAQVFDADCNGALDEVTAPSDPARFELRAQNGITVLQSQTVLSGAADGTILTFPITSPGSYQLVIVNGGIPVSGNATAGLNDDDNTYSVSIPGTTTLIGQFQGTFSPSANLTNLPFYFLVGPGQANLRLRNFDMDGSGTVTYTRPSGATVAGTTSGNGIWNNGGSLNAGQDNVTIAQTAPYADAGQWGITLSSVGATNQFILEANAGTERLVIFDQPPTTADAGNFRITPDGVLPGVIGTPTDHPFSITNFFFTNDIINLALTGTSPNYTTQLIDAATLTPLTDTDADGKVDTGIIAPGITKNYILRVTPLVGAGSTDTTKVNATSFMDARVVPGSITTLFVNKTTQLSNVTNVSGTVYLDLNHNGSLDAGENGYPLTNYFVKLVPSIGGNAVATAAVNPVSGTYQFLSVALGDYNLVLDNNNTLTDTTPTQPPGTSGTEAATGVRPVTVPAAGAINQNFGRFDGEVITGRVFRDTGTGGGTANDGILNGGEVGLSGVAVRLQNAAGSVTYDTFITDASGNYTLYAPATGASLRIIETNPTSYRSTGAQVGTTGGTYSLATDAVTFTPTTGTSYSGINFGDVPPSSLTEDNIRTAAPGETVVMPHIFTAGTAGTLNFSLSAVTNPATGWSNLLYRDTNGDGILQAGEPLITAPLAVTAGQVIPVLVKVFTPLGAAPNSQDAIRLTAALTYANQPSQIETLIRTDLVTVTTGSGLILTKAVDKATAKRGDDITYTITYRNSGNDTVRSIVISDTTPAFTLFRSGATGAFPSGITGVTTAFPTLNTAGPLRWTFTGNLPPGGNGTVTFVVRLQ